MKLETNENLPDFETMSETPSAPPRRERRKSQRNASASPKRKASDRKSSSVRNAAAPKRARKKRLPRRLPGGTVTAGIAAPPNVSPEAAGAIRAYMALGEADRGVVAAFIQALR